MLVLIFLYTIKVRLRNAFIVSLFMLAGYEFAAVFFQDILSTQDGVIIFINNNFFFVSAIVIGILACSMIEKTSKDEFIMRNLIVNEVAQEVLHYCEVIKRKDDENLDKILKLLSEKPRNFDEMLNFYYEVSRLREENDNH